MRDDMTLVREFAATKSEPAFAALVERHIGLVHSAALRQAGDAHLAEEITQAVSHHPRAQSRIARAEDRAGRVAVPHHALRGGGCAQIPASPRRPRTGGLHAIHFEPTGQ